MQIKISVFVVFISLFVLSIFAQAGTAADLAGNWISFENSGFTQKPMVSQKIERLSSAFRKKPYMSDPGRLGCRV